MKKLSVSVMLLVALAGCATSNPNVVARHTAGQMQSVEYARVLSVRDVVIDGTQSGVGAIAGGVVGGVAGSSIGGRRDHIVGGVIAGVAAAALGNAIERAVTTEQGVEISVQFQNGAVRSIVQAKTADAIYPGQSVTVVSEGNKYKVVPVR